MTATLALAPAADAQRRGHYSSDPNVTVDLSVLGGNDGEPVVARPLPAPAGPPAAGPDTERGPDGLLFPPSDPPASRLVGRYATVTPTPRPNPPAASAAPRPSAAAPVSRLNVPAPSPTPEAAGPAPMPKAPVPAAKASAPAAKAPEPITAEASEPAPAQTAAPAPSGPAAPPPPPAMPEPAAAPQPPTAPQDQPPTAPQEESAADDTARTDAANADSTPAEARPAETAARTPGPATSTAAGAPDGVVRILFDDGSAKLPDGARDELQSLVSELDGDDALRVQLEAYAAGTGDTASQARRLSLSRALAVRSFLIDRGVRSTRMDVRALGNKQTESPGPPDRVDARLVTR